jgi:Mor family transcriptional regulator
VWTGKTSSQGYGIIHIGNGKFQVAHRTSWEIHTGEKVPKDLMVLHKCDNPPCVKFKHLFTGNQFDNMRDMIAKGRALFQKDPEKARAIARAGMNYAGRKHYFLEHHIGEESSKAKLNNRMVRQIRKLRSNGASSKEIAYKFKIGKSTVNRVVNKDAVGGWRHVV